MQVEVRTNNCSAWGNSGKNADLAVVLVVSWVALECHSKFGRCECLFGAIWQKADVAVVLVVGGVALECHSKSGRCEQI